MQEHSEARSSRSRQRKRHEETLPQRRDHPLNFWYDWVIDFLWKEKERRAGLTDEQRHEEDERRTAERAEEERKWLKEHEKLVTVRIDHQTEGGAGQCTFECCNRSWLRDGGIPEHAEGDTISFEARDHNYYPFTEFATYDRTGEIPSMPPVKNPVARYVWGGFVPRYMEREAERQAQEAIEARPAIPREEAIEHEVNNLLKLWEESERKRVGMTPKERAVKRREDEEFVRELREDAAEKQRTLLNVRRQGDEDILELPLADIRARKFQTLFAVRQGDEDVYFQANDRKWYRIEAYPEYARTNMIPNDLFLAPPMEKSVLEEAVDRAIAIWRARQHGLNASSPGAGPSARLPRPGRD